MFVNQKLITFGFLLIRFAAKAKFLVLLLCLFFYFNSYTQLPKSDSLVLNDKNWKEIKKEVDYNETYKEQQQQKPFDFSSAGDFMNNTWVQIFTAILIISILVFLIFKLVGRNIFRINQRIEKDINYQLLDDNPDIHEMDLDKMLENVLKNQDYKLAIRIRFLMIIKQLSLNEHIRWEKDKTNGEYISEMYERDELPDFMYLVMVFERIWYGDTVLNISDYAILSKHFENFLPKINIK